jgi:serine/threonine protein kinase
MESSKNKFSNFLKSQYKAVKEKISAENPVEELPRYTQKTLIDEGAQKKVFQVFDANCSREVAMAVLKGNSEEEKAQFRREARITALLQHPNIMPVYETGTDENGQPYFTMKLGRGETLQTLLSSLTKMPQQDLLNLFLKVCEALTYAHSKGILHRDLKPENIYIGQFGEVLLCDWGLANIVYEDCDEKILDDQELKDLNLKVSLKGVIKGTPGFIAPEILKKADYSFQSDVYALGAVFYSLLTGKEHPLPQEEKVLFENNETSESLKAICLKALNPLKEERYQTVSSLTQDIRSYLNGFAPKAAEASSLTQLKLLYKRNQTVCNLSLIFVCSIIIIVSLFVSQLQESNTEREKMEADLMPLYLKQAKDAFLTGKPQAALAVAEVTYNFDRKNNEARNIYGKSLMSVQNFSKAAEILKDVNEELFEIALKCEDIQSFDASKLDRIIAYLKTVGPPPENDKAFIYRNILYEEFSQQKPEAKLRLLKAVLKMRNELKDLKSTLEYKDDAYIIDLSNNPQLKVLNVLAKFGPAVVKKFDISNTGVKNLYEIHNLNIIELHLRNTGKLALKNVNHYYEYLDAEGSNNDFSPFLGNKPVQYLNIHRTPFNNYKVLTTLKKLKTLVVTKGKLPVNVRKKLPANCQIIEK